MANTSSRTLRLLSLLQTHRYWPGPELAERLGVSARTLRRDVERLRELGYPVEAERGVAGGYQLAPGVSMPPLVLDDDEAVAIVVGLLGAAHANVAGVAESSVGALTKVVQVMPPRLRRQVDALRSMTVPGQWGSGGGEGAPGVDPGVLTTIARACRDCERLQFRYTARQGEESEREVEPHRLVSLGRRWYVVAYDPSRHDWRSFRLDRLANPVSTSTRFTPRSLPGGDAARFVRQGIEQLPAPYAVEALVDASAETVRTRIGSWASVEEAGNGQCLLRMTSDSLDWPMMALGVVASPFQVLSPPELLDRMGEWAGRFGDAVSRSLA